MQCHNFETIRNVVIQRILAAPATLAPSFMVAPWLPTLLGPKVISRLRPAHFRVTALRQLFSFFVQNAVSVSRYPEHSWVRTPMITSAQGINLALPRLRIESLTWGDFEEELPFLRLETHNSNEQTPKSFLQSDMEERYDIIFFQDLYRGPDLPLTRTSKSGTRPQWFSSYAPGNENGAALAVVGTLPSFMRILRTTCMSVCRNSFASYAWKSTKSAG